MNWFLNAGKYAYPDCPEGHDLGALVATGAIKVFGPRFGSRRRRRPAAGIRSGDQQAARHAFGQRACKTARRRGDAAGVRQWH